MVERANNTSTLRTFKLTMTIDCVVSSSQSDRTQTPRYVVYIPIVVVVVLLRLFFLCWCQMIAELSCRYRVARRGRTLKNIYNCRVFCLHYHISFRFISIISLLKLCHENESKSNTVPTSCHITPSHTHKHKLNHAHTQFTFSRKVAKFSFRFQSSFYTTPTKPNLFDSFIDMYVELLL